MKSLEMFLIWVYLAAATVVEVFLFYTYAGAVFVNYAIAVLALKLTPPYCTKNCGGGQIQGITVKLPSGVGIQTNNLNFDPATITVVIGKNNTISWVDQDSIPHTVTSLPGAPSSFDSGPV